MTVAAALAVGAAATAAVVVNLPEAQGGSGKQNATPPATTPVTRETLVDTEKHDGTTGYGEASALTSRGAGTVTALAAEGATVKRGAALARIDDDPVTLLYGRLPAYREMRSGLVGADVAQLEQNLKALGYQGFTVDDEYTAATARAVREWQEDLGRAETGRVGPEQIVFAPGTVRVESRTATVGDVVQPGTELLRTTGTAPLVTVELETGDQRLARKGAPVEVTLPDGTTATAKITGVRTTVKPAEDPSGSDTTTITVTVTVPEAKRLTAATVDVAFTVAERKDVLVVPVGALLALAEGGYGLEVVDGAGATRIVTVETGLFAGGKVEVTGSGIAEGTVVGVVS